MIETPTTEQEKLPEKGANVEIVYVGMRHGDKFGKQLTGLGRKTTAQKARESGFDPNDFDMIKPYGSDAGASPNGSWKPRALETAEIYADTIVGELKNKRGTTRKRSGLNYERFKTREPFDWDAFYEEQLPDGFADLSDEEKKEHAAKANALTTQHLFDLADPGKNPDEASRQDAEDHIKEYAGATAYEIYQMIRVSERVNSGSRVMIPSGQHGLSPVAFMKLALVRESGGKTERGFETLEGFGGDFDPSESFTTRIRRDESGQLEELGVTFASKEKRPDIEKMYLDLDTVRKLAEWYAELHKPEVPEGENPDKYPAKYHPQ